MFHSNRLSPPRDFIGGTRGETEWNQWVYSEKEKLSQVMERHGIEWEKLETRDEHLSVISYKRNSEHRRLLARKQYWKGRMIYKAFLIRQLHIK